MTGRISFIGQVFGRLTVEADSPDRVSAGGRVVRRAACRCACGVAVTVACGRLRAGETRSCGCLQKELAAARRSSHGHAQNRTTGAPASPTYTCWQNMLARCGNPNNPAWADYGGRGITVCPRWRDSFENFLADMGARPEGLTIERRENDRGYSPANCVWATRRDQARNRRTRRAAELGP